jgi:hypothetical protein
MTGLFDTVVHQSEKIAELTREIAMREQAYPRRVAEKKMTQAKADRQIAVMRAILEDVRRGG